MAVSWPGGTAYWKATDMSLRCQLDLLDNGRRHLSLVKGVVSVIKSALAGAPVEPARLECCIIPANTDCGLTCRCYFCERKPAFIEVGQCVSRRREGNNEKWVTPSAPGNGCGHDGDQVLGGGLVPYLKKKRTGVNYVALIHLKCWLILIKLLHRDYECLTDAWPELNCWNASTCTGRHAHTQTVVKWSNTVADREGERDPKKEGGGGAVLRQITFNELAALTG